MTRSTKTTAERRRILKGDLLYYFLIAVMLIAGMVTVVYIFSLNDKGYTVGAGGMGAVSALVMSYLFGPYLLAVRAKYIYRDMVTWNTAVRAGRRWLNEKDKETTTKARNELLDQIILEEINVSK